MATRRVNYPDPESEFKDAYVVVPTVWLGEHLLKRDAAVRAAERFNDLNITRAAIALCLAEDWGGIPGLEGREPEKWDFAKVPIALLSWLEKEIYSDFARSFVVPKAPSSPSPAG